LGGPLFHLDFLNFFISSLEEDALEHIQRLGKLPISHLANLLIDPWGVMLIQL
jgi:hypothetical protein